MITTRKLHSSHENFRAHEAMFIVHDGPLRSNPQVRPDELPEFRYTCGALNRHAYATWRRLMVKFNCALRYDVIGPKGRLP